LETACRKRALIAILVLLAFALVGCVSFSVSTTGAASVEELEAENAYVAVYMTHMTRLAEDLKAFAPSGDNPGPCNKGGVKQACHDADVRAIGTLTAMLEGLESVKVPERFIDADGLLREALAKNIEGLRLRNQSLETGDDDAWAKHADALEAAQSAWSAAYAAFPDDHRPALGP
jgi:hypothetical protein